MNNGDAQTETLWKKVDAQGDFFDFWGSMNPYFLGLI